MTSPVGSSVPGNTPELAAWVERAMGALELADEALVHDTRYDETGDPIECDPDCAACAVADALDDVPNMTGDAR